MTNGRFWLQTLGCPKNQVDSEKLVGTLVAHGYEEATQVEDADLVVVNTCAFIEAARQESIDTVLDVADRRPSGARLVVTGCMAERYGQELAEALPEVDLVAGFGESLVTAPTPAPAPASAPISAPVPVTLGARSIAASAAVPAGGFDLLELPRPAARAPWAYVKVAEGCDRICGFCAIPSFRGKQRSRHLDDIVAEVDALVAGDRDGNGPAVREIVLVAQDLASYGRDRSAGARGAGARRGAAPGTGPGATDGDTRVIDTQMANAPIIELVRAVSTRVRWTRLLYLYPSQLTDVLVEAVLETGVPYFDLSLQHVSRPLLVGMRRWGSGERFLERIAAIRRASPEATFRSSFILGYPGETEEDHDALLAFLEEARLDWAGFFPYSAEDGTHAAALADQVPTALAMERLRECAELQDRITATARDTLVGRRIEVLVDKPGTARSTREAPEIDGVVKVPAALEVGSFVTVTVTAAEGPDLVAVPVDGAAPDLRVASGADAAA